MDICVGWPIGESCKRTVSSGPFCKFHHSLYYDAAKSGRVKQKGCLCQVGKGELCGRRESFNLKNGACGAHVQRKRLKGEFGMSPIRKRTKLSAPAIQENSTAPVLVETVVDQEDDLDIIDRVLSDNPEDIIMMFIAQYGTDKLLDLASELSSKKTPELTKKEDVTPVVKKKVKPVREIKTPDCGTLNDDLPAIRETTRGKKMLVVSSRIDNHVIAKVEAATLVETLDTVECDSSNMSCYGERIKNKRYDLVVVSEKFLSHNTTNIITPACKSSGVTLIYSGKGRFIGIMSALAEMSRRSSSSSN
jgi:hypothetical protein